MATTQEEVPLAWSFFLGLTLISGRGTISHVRGGAVLLGSGQDEDDGDDE
jgi:hypothetical protein